MKLTLNIKPVVVKTKTKEEALNLISNDHLHVFGRHGSHLAPYPKLKKNTIRVYSLEKRRKTVERKIIKGKFKSTVICPSHWICFYYDIPTDFLRISRLKIDQGERTFKISAVSSSNCEHAR